MGNSKTYLRIGSDKNTVSTFEIDDVEIKYSLKDIHNYGQRNSNFSKSITVLKTKESEKVFKGLTNINISGGYDVGKKVYGEIVKNGITLLSGNIEVKDIYSDRYEVTLANDNLYLFDLLGDKYITRNIDPSDNIVFTSESELFTHMYDPSIIRNYLQNSPSDNGYGLFYPVIDFNDGLTSISDLENNYPLVPALGIKQIFDKIIHTNGFTYEIDNDISTLMNKMYIPVNNDASLRKDYTYAKYHVQDYNLGDYSFLWQSKLISSPAYVVPYWCISNTYYDSLPNTTNTFIDDNSTNWFTLGTLLTNTSNNLIFTAQIAGTDFSGDTSINNLSGNLTGNVTYVTPNVTAKGQVDSVFNLSGTTGSSIDISVNGVLKRCTWKTDAPTTVAGFCTALNKNAYAAVGITLAENDSVPPDGFVFSGEPGAANAFTTEIVEFSPTFTWTLDTWQTAADAVARVDRITLTGTNGKARILCDGLTRDVSIVITKNGYGTYDNFINPNLNQPLGFQTNEYDSEGLELPYGEFSVDVSLKFDSLSIPPEDITLTCEFNKYNNDGTIEVIPIEDVTIEDACTGVSRYINKLVSFNNYKKSKLWLVARPETTSAIYSSGKIGNRIWVSTYLALDKTSSIELTLKNSLYHKQIININDLLPTYKQKDFIYDIFKMFNCFIESDTTNHLKIKSYTNYYQPISAAVDWTTKVNTNSLKSNPLKNTQTKTTKIGYTNDGNKYVEDYKSKYDNIFGTKIIINDSDFVTGANEITLSSAPTVVKKISSEYEFPIIASPYIYLDPAQDYIKYRWYDHFDPGDTILGIHRNNYYEGLITGARTFTVKSNTHWRFAVHITNDKFVQFPWISCNPAAGYGDTTVVLYIEPNYFNVTRNCSIGFSLENKPNWPDWLLEIDPCTKMQIVQEPFLYS